MSTAVVLMVKNEARGIAKTIRSCNKPFINAIIVYDTGSTDDTIHIIMKESKVPVHLLEGTFENFEISRNVCLKFAKSFNYDYLLFMDADDELICDDAFVFDPPIDEKAWYTDCKWLIHTDKDTLNFKSVRMIRSNAENIKWKGAVHEVLDTSCHKIGNIADISIYQDRIVSDDGKSRERWKRDLVILKDEYARDCENSRTVYYLAQTCQCLGDEKSAREYYALRSEMKDFPEERFSAMMKCGEIDERTDWSMALQWYSKALVLLERAEPLIKIAKIFFRLKSYKISHAYARLACNLEYPRDSILFIDSECYSYDRWHFLGIVSWYALNTQDGYLGCMEAIKVRNRDIDRHNLKFYDSSM